VAGFDVVTGAYGYSGRYIAERLLAAGREVRTLTGRATRADPFGGRVEAFPFSFADPAQLVHDLRGADTLYNTYWVRFAHGSVDFDQAIANTRTLFAAAAEAGVRRVVHVSITNPSEDSPLPYFRGKAVLERALRESGLSHAIVRPTVVFGREDILINNIAWILRRFPLFIVPGTGEYRLQPVYVEDVAAICVAAGGQRDDMTIDAAGQELYTFNALVGLLRNAVRSRARIVHAPPTVALALGKVVGRVVKDVLLTRDEVEGLAANLLVAEPHPLATTSFREWVMAHGDALGRQYASELARHYR
jgi:NADH dehydrogenase